MKKLRLFISACLFAAAVVPSVAQRYYSPDFSIGIKGGATLSQMSFMPTVRQKMTEGMTFGVMARYTEEKLFGLIAELNVTQRGWKEDYEEHPFSYSRRLTYIQLPLLTHIYFGSRHVKCFVNLGPEVGLMLHDRIKADFNYADVSSVTGYPANRRTEQLDMKIANRFDYGIAGGVGCEFFAHRRHSVMLEGRFYYGLGNIFNATKADVFSASRGMSIEITLGYFFRVI